MLSAWHLGVICRSSDADELVARVVGGHDPTTRVELAMEARRTSGTELYRRVYASIKGGERFEPMDTMPADVSVLMNHLRMSEADSSSVRWTHSVEQLIADVGMCRSSPAAWRTPDNPAEGVRQRTCRATARGATPGSSAHPVDMARIASRPCTSSTAVGPTPSRQPSRYKGAQPACTCVMQRESSTCVRSVARHSALGRRTVWVR